MSFSKARLHRFNEITPCSTPSPVATNSTNKPKVHSCVKTTLDNNETKEKSPPSSEAYCVKSSPSVFRTPTVPKKSKIMNSSTKSRLRELFSSSSSKPKNDVFTRNSKFTSSLKTTEREVLKEKIVECQNKDGYIKELMAHLEELKDKINILKKENNDLIVINEKHSMEVQNIIDQYEEKLSKLLQEKAKVIDDLNQLEKEFYALKKENKTEIEFLIADCEKLQKMHQESVSEYEELIKKKIEEYTNKEDELKLIENSCIELQQKHAVEIENLKREHQIEIQNIEFELLKTMTELQKEKENAAVKIKDMEEVMAKNITNLEKTHEKMIADILNAGEDKTLQLNIDWQKKLEEQQKQADAILKECQTISEYNIIQCEIEKNKLKGCLTQKSEEYEQLQEKYNTLSTTSEASKKFNELEMRCASLMTELQHTKNQLHIKSQELTQMASEKKAYEYTINNSQVTIEVLKNRLINSDRDVEQLKKEVSDNEEKLLQYENKCIQLQGELHHALQANEELEMQLESTVKINESEINHFKEDLLRKVDVYRGQVVNFSKRIAKERSLRDEVLEQLHESMEGVTHLSTDLENVKSTYELEISKLQDQLNINTQKEQMWIEAKQRLEDLIETLKTDICKKDEENTVLKKKLDNLEEKINSVDASSFYKSELEKDIAEAVEIRKKYIEQSGKYDELLQKYEELQLQVKNQHEEKTKSPNDTVSRDIYDQLLQKFEKLDIENSNYKKKLEQQKLIKDKLKTIAAEDKENIGSPNRSLNSSRIDSPFRDRN